MQKHFTIILFLLTIYADVSPQANYARMKINDQYIDSLKMILPTLKDSARIDCLNNLSESYLSFNYANNIIARSYVKQALAEALKIEYIPGQANAYLNLGRVESLLITNFPAEENYFNKALSLYLKSGNTQQIACAWAALGSSKWVLSKFSESLPAYEKAVHLFASIHDTINLLATYDNMVSASVEWGHYSKSLEYTLKLQELTGKEDSGKLCRLYSLVGDEETARQYWTKNASYSGYDIWDTLYIAGGFVGKKQYDSALRYYQLFSGFAQICGPGPQIKLYDGLGNMYLGMKQYDSALLYVHRSLHLSKKANDRNQVMVGLKILTNVYYSRNDYKRAIQTVRELLQLSRLTGARQFTLDANLLLSQFYDHLQKKDSAYIYLRQYILLKDSVDLDLFAQKLAFYKTKSEREQAKSKINALNNEKKLQQHQLEQTAQQKRFLIAGIAALLLIGVVLFRNALLTRRNEKHLRELTENELKIQKLESEKTKIEFKQQSAELEMQALRAQMNPHFIFNCLNAINGFILVNDSETAADYLTKFSRLIRMVLNNSQKKFISLDEELETLGLYLYMERLRFKNNFHYNINCDETFDAMLVYIPPLLLQPFVENAIWHGLMPKEGNRELSIGLHLENNILHCTITDNGIGRKKASMLKSKSAEKNKSMGMQITKNRLALLNEDLNNESFFEIHDIEDTLGNATGTIVFVKIKIKEAPEENVSENLLKKIIDQ